MNIDAHESGLTHRDLEKVLLRLLSASFSLLLWPAGPLGDYFDRLTGRNAAAKLQRQQKRVCIILRARRANGDIVEKMEGPVKVFFGKYLWDARF